MESNQRKVTVTLTPAQLTALTELSRTEECEIETLVARGVDTLLATYASGSEIKRDNAQQHTIKLLISLMKIAGQTLYFTALPLTAGPVKARLNQEGVAIQWQQSEKFAVDLLTPPELIPPAEDGSRN